MQASPHPEDKEIAVALNSSTILSRGAIEAFVGIYNETKESSSTLSNNIRVCLSSILTLLSLYYLCLYLCACAIAGRRADQALLEDRGGSPVQ